jgi:hypothetical protein
VVTFLANLSPLPADLPETGLFYSSDVVKKNTLILSDDPVAADAKASLLFGKRPQDIGYIRLAKKWGLGTHDFSKLLQKNVSVQIFRSFVSVKFSKPKPNEWRQTWLHYLKKGKNTLRWKKQELPPVRGERSPAEDGLSRVQPAPSDSSVLIVGRRHAPAHRMDHHEAGEGGCSDRLSRQVSVCACGVSFSIGAPLPGCAWL